MNTSTLDAIKQSARQSEAYLTEEDIAKAIEELKRLSGKKGIQQTLDPKKNKDEKNKESLCQLLIRKDCHLNLKNIRLLTKEEFWRYQRWIPQLCHGWFLNDPSDTSSIYVGAINKSGKPHARFVNKECGVRPVIEFQMVGDEKINPGDKMCIGETVFTVIDKNLIIADACIMQSVFDYEGNVYSGSEVEKAVELWFERLKNGV